MAVNRNRGSQYLHILHTKLIVVAADEQSFTGHKSLIKIVFGNYLRKFRQHEDVSHLSSSSKQIGYHCEFNDVHRDTNNFHQVFLQSCRLWCKHSISKNYKLWLSTENEKAFSSQSSRAKNVHQGIRLASFSLGSMLDRCTFIQHYKHKSAAKSSILDFEHDSKFLSIAFYTRSEGKHRLRVRYEDLQNFILINDSETSPVTAFFMLKTPPKFHRFDENDDDKVTYARVNHTNDCSAKVIGNSSVLSLTVKAKDESYEKFQQVMGRLHTLGFSIYWSYVTVQRPSTPSNNPDFCDEFRMAYAFHCLLSQGFSITDRAEGLKSKLRELQPNQYLAAERALQQLAVETELTLEGDRFIDLATQFEIKFQSLLVSGDYEEERYNNYRYVRRAIVTPTRCMFLPAELMAENRILRQFGEEYCVRIVFRDETFFKLGSFETSQSDEIQHRVVAFLSSGIRIANRHYKFLACSNSQLRDHGCWLYARDQDGNNAADIRDWMGTFTNIKCVATYISRMGQCFSTSEESVKVSVEDGQVAHEEDVTWMSSVGPDGKKYCFSDGIGKVSQTLANRIASEVNKKKVPSAFQIRYSGCKGMIAIDPTIRGDKLIIRPSMNKFESTHEGIEVMNNSSPCRLYLNRQAITLLSGLEIPDEVFQELQENMLYELGGMFFDDTRAAESLSHRSKHSAINYRQVARAGISLTNEPFFRNLLLAVYRNWIGQLQIQARIEIPPEFGRNMVGVLDETGTLRYGQVFVQYSKDVHKPQVSKEVYMGPLVISKFPALHPGDFRKFTAVDVPQLHHMVDCIVFPQRGKRPHPDEMAGSDLDGDEYFVTWMPELIFDGVNEEPMDFISPPKKIHTGPIAVSDMIKYIADYIKNDNLGLIANAHLAQADNQRDGIFSPICTQIAEIHAEAVDFAKTGYSPDLEKEHRPRRYPDFMRKRDKSSYKSERILGSLYRQCRQIDRIAIQQKESSLPDIPYDEGLEHPGWENYKEDAERSRNRYNRKLESILTQYGITSESEALSGNISQLGKRFTQRNEIYDTKNIIGVKVRILRNATRRAFFEEFGGQGNIGEVFTDDHLAKASACYITTYNDPERKYLSFPWVVSDVLCEVRKRSSVAVLISVPSIMQRLSVEAESGPYSQLANTERLRRLLSAEMVKESPRAQRNQGIIVQHIGENPWIRTTIGVLMEWRSNRSLRKVIRKWELLTLLLGYAIQNDMIRPRGDNTSLTTNDDLPVKLLLDFFSFCASRKFHSSAFRRIPQGCKAPSFSKKAHLDRISNAADKAYHNVALCGTIDSIIQDTMAEDEIQEESVTIGNNLYASRGTWLQTLKDEFPEVEVSTRQLTGARYSDAKVTIKGRLSQVYEVQDRIEEWESEPPARGQRPLRNAEAFAARFSMQHGQY